METIKITVKEKELYKQDYGDPIICREVTVRCNNKTQKMNVYCLKNIDFLDKLVNILKSMPDVLETI